MIKVKVKRNLLIAAFTAIAASALADWNPGDPAKWVQMPDLLNGMDVRATAPKILADDFLCTLTGPITDVHIWGSWLNDLRDPNVQFKLSFHTDVPAGVDTPWSHPGQEVWSMLFSPSQFQQRFWADSTERFYDPNQHQVIGFDTQVWQYNFFIPEALAFHQDIGNVYWLDVQAYTTNGLFGWKTSNQHYNDDAVFADLPVPLSWQDMHDPNTGQSLDMAFVLTTIPEPSTFALVGLSAAGLMIFRRRK